MALSTLPLRAFGAAAILAAIGGAAPQQQAPADEFAQSIRPVLTRNCASCHTARSRINFLKAENAKDIEANRGLWRNVAAQLRNRTMPPVETKLTEDERLRMSPGWMTICARPPAAAGDFAGRRRPAPPESPRIPQHHSRPAGRGLQRLRTVPERRHGRLRVRHQWRDPLHPAAR